MQLHRKLIRLWRRKVAPEEHHGEEERCLSRTWSEGRAVDRRRLRLVHFDPEEGEVVRHLGDAEARIFTQVRPIRLQMQGWAGQSLAGQKSRENRATRTPRYSITR